VEWPNGALQEWGMFKKITLEVHKVSRKDAESTITESDNPRERKTC